MAGVEERAGLRLGTPAGRWVLLATVLASGVAMLDATVVNVALPALAEDLDAGLAGLQWTVNGYTLTLASLILLGGSLGDRLGRRRVLVAGAVWFGVASVLCALAPTVEALVVARALQGVGGALLTPGSLAIIAASFHPDDRARAVGAWSGLGGVAGAAGPFLGGWLVGTVGWRGVFLVNVPLVAVVVAVALRHVPETRDPGADGRLDVPGAVLGALGLGGVTYALVAAGEQGWSPAVAASGAAGALALAAFVVAERRGRSPMVPPGLFASRQFTATNAATAAVYAALGAVFFLLVLQLQVVSGFSPLAAGTALLPVTAVMLVGSARAGALAQRTGPRLPMTAGPLVAAGGLLLLLRVGPGAGWVGDVLPAALLLGLGLTLTVAPLTAAVLAAAPAEHAGVASGVNNAVARAAQLLAVAVVPLAAGLGEGAYGDPARFDAGFRVAMVLSAGLMVLGALVSAAFVRGGAAGAPLPAPAGPAPAEQPAPVPSAPVPSPRSHCAVDGPPLLEREERPSRP
ncbi:MFS transporter [Vallicoccus soli]|uniref:MFS transporter n=1 Tax=Vallicoccus soli TaxID=2339232 RepID=UPI001FE59998|nr:MFS transporter [Vallicoccus soli]